MKGKKILIIDDSYISRRILHGYLEHQGILDENIMEFKSPCSALDYIKKSKTDVIFLDIRMPIMNGYTFYNNLDPVDQEKVVFSSACSTDLRIRFELEKPINIEKLKKILLDFKAID